MSLFRKNRNAAAGQGGISRYLAYALGEIILVIVGILLGLSLNKWNEHRKLVDTFENELQIVASDLRQDTADAGSIISFYEEARPSIEKLTQGMVDSVNLDSCAICLTFLSAYRPFFMEKRGFELLGKYTDQASFREDTLLSSVMLFYSNHIELRTLTDKLLYANMERNIISWQNEFDWFSNVFAKREWDNPAFRKYVREDPGFQNKMTYQSILVFNNYVPFLESFRTNAEELLTQLDERVEEESSD